VTAKNRYARALAAVTAWCRVNRHQPIPERVLERVYHPAAFYARLRAVAQMLDRPRLDKSASKGPAGRQIFGVPIASPISNRLVGLDPAEYAPLVAPLVDLPLPRGRALTLSPEECGAGS
jgi:hypothetical protein